MSSEIFDVAIIGAGPGGYVAAIRAAQLGLKTVCIEKDATLGGTCLNIGCIPSKALLDSSEHFHFARNKSSKHGVMVKEVTLDLPQMMKRKDTVVRQLTGGVDMLFKKNKITRVRGFGKITDAKSAVKKITVRTETGDQTIEARNLILATGSAPIELPFLKFDGKKVISSTEALSLPQVPKHMVVIGGGVIGLELGSVWLRLGARVTVVEYMDMILPGMDSTVVNELLKMLKKQGMDFRLGTKCLGAQTQGDWIRVDAEDNKTKEKLALEADVILVCVGRRPYLDGLGAQEAGIALDERGRVKIDRSFQTNLPGVFAIGDIVDGPMLAHKAEDEGAAAAEIIAGKKPHVQYAAIPGVVYTWPEVASVGFTEEELKQTPLQIKVGTFPFLANGRAKAMDETEGLVKIISDQKSDRILGIHIVGPRASDMIAEAVAFMEMGGTTRQMAQASHAHPTLAEVAKEAALAVDKRAIHI